MLLTLNTNAQTLVNVDNILRANEAVPKVMLVGTFHFGYPGLDTHKTEDKYKVDILSPEKQIEVKELLDYISKFKPTKIMVETGNSGYLVERYRNWQSGKEKLGRREVDQIGLKLMKRFNLDTIYGVDANSLSYELSRSKDSLKYEKLLNKVYGEYEEKANAFDDRYWKFYDKEDELTFENTLLDYFLHQNTDKVVKRMHGHYILGNGLEDYNDVDGLLLNWYSRNLRIYKNIINIETTPKDRILVLFGAGHIGILMQQFESNPAYDLVKFGDLQK